MEGLEEKNIDQIFGAAPEPCGRAYHQKKDTVYYLNFDSQIRTLDGELLPVFIAKCLANFINYKGYLNGQKADLSNLLNVKITSPLAKDRIITPKITAVELNSDKSNYVVSIKIE